MSNQTPIMERIEDFQQKVGDHSEVVAESFACLEDDHHDHHQQQLQQVPRKKKKKKGNKDNTRRFSDEQVRSLELMFESDTKLEPRKKNQLARELGLQPRQVAIWFQNRRARWKAKQIEKEYKTLKANYDTLASSYESLKSERESLVEQLQRLNDLLGNHFEGQERCDRGIASVFHEGNTNFIGDQAQQGLDITGLANLCDGHKSMENGQSGDESGQGFFSKGSSEYSDGTLASVFSPDSGGQFDLSWNSSHWFNLWA